MKKDQYIALAIILTVCFSFIGFIAWLIIDDVEQGPVTKRYWSRTVKHQKLGPQQETTSWFTASQGVIERQWTESYITMSTDTDGNLVPTTENETHYLYRPWVTQRRFVASGGYAKLIKWPEETEISTESNWRRIAMQEYKITVNEREFKTDYKTVTKFKKGDVVEVRYKLSELRGIKLLEGETVTEEDFDVLN